MKGKYIYAIIKSNEGQKNFAVRGIGGNGVFALGYQNLAALASTTKLQTYETLPKEETVRDLVAHQKVIEDVMKEAAVLPVKFGTMLAKVGEITEVIKKGYPLLKAALKKMDGKIEIDLVATQDTAETIKEIYGGNKKIQKQQQKVVNSREGDTLHEKLVLGEMVAKELEGHKTKRAEQIMGSLERFAHDICPHDLFAEEMVFNAAFLLEKTKYRAFEKAIEALDKKFTGRLDFRLVGPLPPYSFATVVVRKFRQDEVERAKEVLGLNADLSLPKVKGAYHRRAERLHPDKGGNSLGFGRVDSAYKLLREFCQKGQVSVEIMKWGEY